MADKYILRVTAGPSYDIDTHTLVPVNDPSPVHISHPEMEIDLNVRIRNYCGLPRGSPSHSKYFDMEPHKANGDQYSIAMRFKLRRPEGEKEERGEEDVQGVSGVDLQFGNDFDHPIRDRLPPGFGTAMNIVKWWVDPGLEGDVYADEPYLYGAALSSFNKVWVGGEEEGNGGVEEEEGKGGLVVEEGGDEMGMEKRREWGVPEGDSGKERMKWGLKKENRERWVWEYGRTYGADFFNPYVDFGEFALRLPGFTLPVIKYWDGQGLRYVLRNHTTGQTYLVVLFTLHLKEDVNEDGSLKPAALQATKRASGGKGDKGQPMKASDTEVFVTDSVRKEAEATNDDDVD